MNGRRVTCRGEADLESVFAHPLMFARRVRERRSINAERSLMSGPGRIEIGTPVSAYGLTDEERASARGCENSHY